MHSSLLENSILEAGQFLRGNTASSRIAASKLANPLEATPSLLTSSTLEAGQSYRGNTNVGRWASCIAFAPRIASTCWCMCMVILYCGFPATKWSYNCFTGVVLGAFYIFFQISGHHNIKFVGALKLLALRTETQIWYFGFSRFWPVVGRSRPQDPSNPSGSGLKHVVECTPNQSPKPTIYKQTSSPVGVTVFPPLLCTRAQGQHKPGVALGAADRE